MPEKPNPNQIAWN